MLKNNFGECLNFKNQHAIEKIRRFCSSQIHWQDFAEYVIFGLLINSIEEEEFWSWKIALLKKVREPSSEVEQPFHQETMLQRPPLIGIWLLRTKIQNAFQWDTEGNVYRIILSNTDYLKKMIDFFPFNCLAICTCVLRFSVISS